MRVLIVEDDARIAAALRRGLTERGVEVFLVGTASLALQQLHERPDAVLLDINLPDGDGFSVCQAIRGRSTVPILMTTGRADYDSRIRGLGAGADDYLIKPYHLGELMARIEAVTRRSTRPVAGPQPVPAEPDTASLQVDLAAREVSVDGRRVELTRREFDLLVVLGRCPGDLVRHEEIMLALWPDRRPGGRQRLHVHIASLRQKLGDADLIESVHGTGYRLRVPSPKA